MKAVILNGTQDSDTTGQRIRTVLTAQLQSQGWDVDHFALCEQKIGNCAGDFFCWIRTPGICNVNDDNRAIAAAAAASDLLVLLAPVAFGGYAPALKGMVDHLIQNVSPFFTKVNGETHHVKRYRHNPDLLVVGWLDAPDAQAEAVFRHLVQRNALNFHARTWVSKVVLANRADEVYRRMARQAVADLEDGRSSQEVMLPAMGQTLLNVAEIRRALLLVGSPKTRKSTSHALGSYLYEQLAGRAIATETIYLHTVLSNPHKMQALLDSVAAADLVTLAFPLYVDALPAPVVEALERIVAARRGKSISRRQMFAAIANCGFPEAHQCATALAICRTFARQAGFTWAGALALGGGEMIGGITLVEGGGKTLLVRQALAQTAAALVQGRAVPEAARAALAKPIIPHRLYWLLAGLGWLRRARQYGAVRLLRRQPYLANSRSLAD